METKRNIVGISLISASACNLQCSFCYLHKNSAYKAFDKIIQQAWENQTYIPNVAGSLRKIGADTQDIKQIELWGGETLLFIKRVTANIPLIFATFPNVQTWRISTNFLIDISEFTNFLMELDKNALQEQNLILQLSIDGPPGEITDQGHHGNWDIYRKNMEALTYWANNTKLNNLTIRVMINATVNKTLYLKYFSTYDGIKDYVQYMKTFCEDFHNRCISRNIFFEQKAIFPGFALPYTESTEEGLELSRILRLWELVRANEFPDLMDTTFDVGIGELSCGRRLDTSNPECGELVGTLTFIPDGTIVECSGCYIDHFEPYQRELEQEGNITMLQRAKATVANTNYNPHNMTPEELEQIDWQMTNGYKSNVSTYLTFMMGACQELALCGQIPYKYYLDKELCYKHLTALANLNSCTRENLLATGIPYLTDVSCFRRYMNGAMEYIYDNARIEQQRRGLEYDTFGRK